MTTTATGFLGARGVATPVAKQPFWKPENKKLHVLLLDVRAPTKDEEKRSIVVDGQDVELRAILIATVKHGGIEKRWEITSTRAAQALDTLPADTKLPAWVAVQMHGRGKDTTYTVELEAPPAPAKRLETFKDRSCEESSCTRPYGHTGDHGTKPGDVAA